MAWSPCRIGCCAYQTRVKHTMSGVPRVGVGVLLWQGESVLVGRRKGSHGSGQWALPGGKLDFAETLEACAARELQEEAGVQIPAESFQRAWVTSTVFDAATHYVTVFMQAEMPEEQEPQNLEPEKCSGWHWHALSEVPEPRFQPLNEAIQVLSSLGHNEHGHARPSLPLPAKRHH
ncbi:hypothetical protein WJX84_011249 [Apatococcus fuscideae]|uniref:Nudix hydrolase domain-containing protein n=1 Tax=Apatococcus fuscideae TaxID=2026836 RepID=A0AAW1S3Y9_9CHLO